MQIRRPLCRSHARAPLPQPGAGIALAELGRAVRDGYDDAADGGWLRELVESLAADGLAAVEGGGGCRSVGQRLRYVLQ